jgi:hypothetical protein
LSVSSGESMKGVLAHPIRIQRAIRYWAVANLSPVATGAIQALPPDRSQWRVF